MMNPFTKFFASLLTAELFFIYAIGAFCQWNVNPGEWSAEARGVAAIFAMLFWALTIMKLPKNAADYNWQEGETPEGKEEQNDLP